MTTVQIMQEALLYGLLQKLESQYLTKDLVCSAILTGDQSKLHWFERMEAVGHAVLTALRFRDYRRAARLLIVFERLCRCGTT